MFRDVFRVSRFADYWVDRIGSRRRRLVLVAAAVAAAGLAVLLGLILRRDGQGPDRPEPTDRGFTTRDGAIYDPDGVAFLPRGINEFAGPTFEGWAGPVADPATVNSYVDGWNFNLLRIVTCPNGECLSHIGMEQGDDLEAVIRAYTSRRVVVVLDHHGLSPEEPPSAAQTAEAVRWFRETASKYRENPYVWLETFNEPCDDYFPAGCAEFASYTEEIIRGIREASPNVMIVVSTGQYGQDRHNTGGVPERGDSMILQYGPQWQRQYGNIVWDLHVYDRWAETSPEDFRSYFKQIQDAGVAVFVGETGGVPGGGPGDDSGQAWTAARNLYESRVPGVGIVAWSAVYFNATTGDRASDIDSQSDPTNLTEQGRTHWDWTHDPPPAVP